MNRVVLLLLAMLAAGCGGPSPGPSEALDGLSPAFVDGWREAREEAQRAYQAGRWEEAASWNERAIALVPSGPIPGWLVGENRLTFYNLACCRALAGRTVAALDALEAAVGEGFGTVLEFEHLRDDPDLVPLHGENRWNALVELLTRGDGIRGEGRADGRSGTLRTAIVEVWDESLLPRPDPHMPDGMTGDILLPDPPYLLASGRRSWTTRLDPGEAAATLTVRWLEVGNEDIRSVLLARGARPAAVAWEVLLRRPDAFDRAVIEGPAPPAWSLLDRGAEKVRTEVAVVGTGSAPDPRAGFKVRTAASVEEALR